MDTDTLTTRAISAYYSADPNQWGAPLQHASDMTGVETVDDLTYVTIRNSTDLLAVYRVTNQGQLRRLRRWPAALDAESAKR